MGGALRVPSSAPVRDPFVITSQATGEVTLDYLTCATDTAVLEATTDLVHWTSLETNTADANGLIHFIDQQVNSYPWRFYRMRRP